MVEKNCSLLDIFHEILSDSGFKRRGNHYRRLKPESIQVLSLYKSRYDSWFGVHLGVFYPSLKSPLLGGKNAYSADIQKSVKNLVPLENLSYWNNLLDPEKKVRERMENIKFYLETYVLTWFSIFESPESAREYLARAPEPFGTIKSLAEVVIPPVRPFLLTESTIKSREIRT